MIAQDWFFQVRFHIIPAFIFSAISFVILGLVPRPAQIVCGSYPISQTREPYSALLFLAQRIDLPKVLKLPKRDKPWTVFDICEAW